MRQIAGVFAQLDKSRLIGKLKAARHRLRATGRKVEGRKALAECDTGADIVAEAKRLRCKSQKTGKARSLRKNADELDQQGYTIRFGRPFAPGAKKRLIEFKHIIRRPENTKRNAGIASMHNARMSSSQIQDATGRFGRLLLRSRGPRNNGLICRSAKLRFKNGYQHRFVPKFPMQTSVFLDKIPLLFRER